VLTRRDPSPYVHQTFHRAVITMSLSDLLALLTPTGREVGRRRRRANAEAVIAIERIEAARLIAGIVACQLRLSELDRSPAAQHPAIARCDAELRETLGEILRHEVYRFWDRTEGTP
jgi:hypothetical protein